MLKPTFFAGVLCLLFACNNAPSSNAEAAQSAETPTNAATHSDADGLAITHTIHSFYAWYDAFQKDESKNISITSEKGKHLILDKVKMEQYFVTIKASGYFSDEFINNEKIILKKCEEAWQNEEIGDVPSCLDGDRYFCAQDWDIEFWTKAPVSTESLGADHVKATMSGTEGAAPHEQQLELKKENGKWVITSIYCEML